MRIIFYLGLILAFLVMGDRKASAQTSERMVAINASEKDITEMLPSIAELQALAVENSPLLKLYDAEVVIGELQVKSKKRQWMRGFGIEGGAKYGLFDNLVIREDLGVGESETQTTEQTRYNLGVYMKMPLASLIDRSTVNMARAESDKLKYQRESTHNELKKLVIIQYGNVLKAHKKIVIFISEIETLKAQLIEAELNYKNGKVRLAEYSKMKNDLLDSELTYEESKVEFFVAIKLLQETVGKEFKLKQ